MLIIENVIVYEGPNCQNQGICLMVLKKITLEEMLVFLKGDNRIQITPSHNVRSMQKSCMSLVKSSVDLKKCFSVLFFFLCGFLPTVCSQLQCDASRQKDSCPKYLKLSGSHLESPLRPKR